MEQAESILELKEWMGHANVQTTMRYLHYKSKAGAARRLELAFAGIEGSGVARRFIKRKDAKIAKRGTPRGRQSS